MARPSVSLAMIVKNEEENLPQLFKSFEGCFDEVFLTDTGSSDGTVELAKRLGAKVSHFPWIDDFSAARNHSFEQVKTDYVAWLDADDVLESKEGFNRFRDDVMGLADYWIAPYHYSSDDKGNATCTFARERVFKVDKGMRWRYFLHEGVMPQSLNGQVRIQTTNAWVVRHKRTQADMLKDRSRNLSIFHKKLGQGQTLDCRMRYYYGKELFEAGNPAEAIISFSEALKDPKLELHDRILGMQYICFSFIMTNQFVEALKIAHQGILLMPHRAEFHCLMGDCYLKMGKIADSIPHFHAAKSCLMQGQNGITPIFSQQETYSSYPANQLARVYANIGALDKSEQEAKHSFEKFGDTHSKQILDEIDSLKKKMYGYKFAKKTNEIVITCTPQSPYEWDSEVAKTKSMGGSETACIEMAHWLHKLSGRPVKVFNMRKEDQVIDGVEYISAQKVHDYLSENEPWIHVAWRHNFKLTNASTFLWCHDLITQGGENHANYDKIMCLTPFHKRFVQAMQNIPDEKIYVTRNGIDPEKFKGLETIKKDPFRFVYGSSPDRGLDRAMRVLDKVREKYPDITLWVHYGISHLDNYAHVTGGMSGKELRIKLEEMMKERPWVKYVGATQQNELMRSYAESSYCVQPSDFIETSCISAMELICCGVYPIMRRIGGVSDTLSIAEKNGMATLVDSDCITESEYQTYVDATIKAIDEESYKRVSTNPELLSWESVAATWLKELPEFAAQRGDLSPTP